MTLQTSGFVHVYFLRKLRSVPKQITGIELIDNEMSRKTDEKHSKWLRINRIKLIVYNR